jgi:glycosyltransferase involved in cell wall biosynthesis
MSISPINTESIFKGKSVVLVVLNNFINDSRVLKTAKTLQAAGLTVRICALHDQGLPKFTDENGIQVHRIYLRTRKLPKYKVFQIFKYLEFMIRSVNKFKGIDLVHCNDLNALPIGVILGKLNRRIKVVYDAHEFEIHRSGGQSALSIKANFYLENALIKHADMVTVTSEANVREYVKMYNIPRPGIVLNCPPYRDVVDSGNIFREKFGIQSDTVVFLYQGLLAQSRGISVMLEAFSKIKDSSACIVFMGYGDLEGEVVTYSNSHANIFFHPAVPPEQLIRYTSSADFGLIFMANTCANHNYALPNKLFEYVMSGLPTVSTKLEEIERVMVEHNLGLVAKGEDAQSLYDSVTTLSIDDVTAYQKSLSIAKKVFCWENQEKVILDSYRSMLRST